MKRLWHFLVARRHAWIVLLLLAANGVAWLNAAPMLNLPEARPYLDPQIAELRDTLWSRQHPGETFAITVTDQMASEAVAWFLDKHPEVPFSRPQVQFTPQGISGRGIAGLFGVRTLVYGRISVELRDGLPVIALQELGVAGASAPGFLVDAIQAELDRQSDVVQRMPMRLTRLELQDGRIILEGVYGK